jgi:hypothetical protein
MQVWQYDVELTQYSRHVAGTETLHFEMHGERQSLHNTGSAGGGGGDGDGDGGGGGGGTGPSDGRQWANEGMNSKDRTAATTAALRAKPAKPEAIGVVTI